MFERGEQLKCHEGMWENPAHFNMRIETFAEFWPYYVRAHSRPVMRILHATGSVLAIVCVGLALGVNLWFLAAAPVIGYTFARYAHFFVQHTTPAPLEHPFYSLAATHRLEFLM